MIQKNEKTDRCNYYIVYSEDAVLVIYILFVENEKIF